MSQVNWEKHFRAMRPKVTGASFGSDFGAVERGIRPPGVTGAAVIPPGRYWLDAYGDKIARFQAWAAGKPEVSIETTQSEPGASPPHLFVIFTIPGTASNYGMSGVLFPTTDLGFPEGADATVQTSDDVVQKPVAETSTQVLSDITHAAGAAAGAAAQGAAGAFDTTTLIKFGVAAVIAIIALPPILKLVVKPL